MRGADWRRGPTQLAAATWTCGPKLRAQEQV